MRKLVSLGLLLVWLAYAQNVGIGTSTPLTRLHVAGGDGTYIRVSAPMPAGGGQGLIGYQLYNSSTGEYWTIYQADPDGGYGVIPRSLSIWEYPQNYGSNCCRPRFTIMSSNGLGAPGQVVIDGYGNVGIGTTNPTAQLHTTGTVRFANYASGPNGAILRTDNSGNLNLTNFTGNSSHVLRGDGTFGAVPGAISFGCATNNYVPKVNGTNSLGCSQIFDNGTNVGIGTTNPTNKLQIGPNPASHNGNDLTVSNSNGSVSIWNGSGYAHIYSSQRLDLLANGNGMSITTAGNVGVGTTTPSYRFTIAGGGNVFAVDNTATFLARNSSGTYEAYLWPRWSDNIMYLNYGAGGFNIRNNTGVNTVFMTNDNRVGIGTTNPLGRLHVSGDLVIGNGAQDGPRLIWRGGSGGSQEYRARVFTDGRLSFFPVELGHPNFLGEVLALTQNSRVGIRQTAPGGLFELGLDEGRKPGSSTWTVVSDERLKSISGSYTKGLSEILQLHPIVYQYKNHGNRTFHERVLNTQFVGFTAQEVQKVFPECVQEDEDGYLALNIHAILIAYTNAIKELHAQVQAQSNEIAQLKSENAQLRSLLETLSQRLAAVEAKMGYQAMAPQR